MGRDENEAKKRRQLRKLWDRTAFILLSPVRFFKALCFSIGLAVLLTAAGLGIWFYFVVRSLPDLAHMDFRVARALAEKSIVVKLEDKSHPHHWVDLNQVSRDCIYAIVMSEDSGFFDHSGLDYEAILNSIAENLRKKKYEYGASTISQQVVKNVFLKNEKTLVRKIKEWLLTSRLEAAFNKNQILEIYLNVAEFGRDLFGIEQAARYYFDKTPSSINAAEAAFIALMLPSPRKNQYALFQNRNLPETKRRKIRRVLGDMLANELISARQYHQYTKYNFFRVKRAALAEEP